MWGPPLQTLHRSLTARVLTILFLLPMGLGLLYLTYYAATVKRGPGSGATALIGLCAAAIVALSVWIIYRESTRQVWVHNEGIKLKKGSQFIAIAWDSVDEIFLHAVKVQAGGLIGMAVSAAVEALSKDPFDLDKSSTNVTVTIVGGGQKIKMTKADKGCVQAFRFASERVNPRLLDKFARVVREGGTAQFNKISLSLQGVAFGNKAPIPFAEVEKLEVDGGFIKAKKKGKWLSAGSMMTAQVPNAMVLITLFDTLTGSGQVRTEKDLVGRQYV